MRVLFSLKTRAVITASILGFYFMQDETQKLYKSIVSKEVTSDGNDEFLYIDNQVTFNLTSIYNIDLSLFPSYGDPFKLLNLAESNDPSTRRKALRLLTEKPELKEYQYRQIAQSCSNRTIASLARIKDVDARLFIPVPKLVTAKIENPIEREELFDEEFEEPQEKLSEYDQCKKSLQHLTVDTLLQEEADEFIAGNGLAYLQHVLTKYPDEVEFHRYIAFVLANLSQREEFHSDIIHKGWALVLHQWMQSDDIKLFFQANRALANLDRDWETDINFPALYEEGIYLGHPIYRSRTDNEEIAADIVFIHGLQGGPFKTWRQRDKVSVEDGENGIKRTKFWPKDWLVPDLAESVRVINVGFNAASSSWSAQSNENGKNQTLKQISSILIDKLRLADVGSRPVIWVGHSMGGLVIKEILFTAERDPSYKQFSKNTAGVIFCSTPHRGSIIASYATRLLPLRATLAVKDLVYGNEYLEELHQVFTYLVLKNEIPCLSFGESETTYLGFGKLYRKIVESESADPGVGEFHEISCSHINSCKPESKDDFLYKHTLSFIRKCIHDSKISDHSQEEDAKLHLEVYLSMLASFYC